MRITLIQNGDYVTAMRSDGFWISILADRNQSRRGAFDGVAVRVLTKVTGLPPFTTARLVQRAMDEQALPGILPEHLDINDDEILPEQLLR